MAKYFVVSIINRIQHNCIIQLMHNIQHVDKMKILKYLKVLQHVSDHRGSIISEPCTVLGKKLQE